VGERRKLPQRGLGWSPSRKCVDVLYAILCDFRRVLVHFVKLGKNSRRPPQDSCLQYSNSVDTRAERATGHDVNVSAVACTVAMAARGHAASGETVMALLAGDANHSSNSYRATVETSRSDIAVTSPSSVEAFRSMRSPAMGNIAKFQTN